MQIDIVTLDAIKLDDETGAPLIGAKQPVTGDDDVEDFGDIPQMQCLGVSSAPWQADDSGRCEGVVIGGAGSRNGVCVGARDTRTNDIVGNLKPGDTVVHTTGPSKAAQLQLKESKRQALLVTKTTDGKTAVCGLDGANDKFSIALLGYVVEVSEQNGISLLDRTGKAGIQIKDGMVLIMGGVVLGGRTPQGMILGGAGAAGVAPAVIPGVFWGSP